MLVGFVSEVTKGSLERQGGLRGSKKKNQPQKTKKTPTNSVTSVVEVWSPHREN